jgi:heptosyltransferase-2
MKFLLIRFSSLGDVILASPAAENIKKNQPRAEVDILTKDEYSPVFLNNPFIDRVLTQVPLKTRYDFLIDLHDSIRSNLVKYIIPAKNKLTYDKAAYERRVYLYSRKRSEKLDSTVIDRYLEPLENIGFEIKSRVPRITVTDEEINNIKNMVPEKFIAIAPGAKWETKKWSADQYTGLAKKIIRDFQMEVVLLGGEEDAGLCDEISREAGILKRHITNLAGRIGLRELCAVIKISKVLISGDSAPVHIGWAVGANIIALYGPTVKEFGFQPNDPKVIVLEKDMECRPCSLHGSNRCKYRDRACMKRIEIFEVADGIKKLLC